MNRYSVRREDENSGSNSIHTSWTAIMDEVFLAVTSGETVTITPLGAEEERQARQVRPHRSGGATAPRV